MDWGTLALIAVAAALEIIGDLALKLWAEKDIATYFGLGLLVYVGSLVLFAVTLRRAPLAIIFALWVGMAIVGLTLMGWRFFDEPLGSRQIVGIVLVIIAIFLLRDA
jgi:multidrug transporter EmrE-like cation transporter